MKHSDTLTLAHMKFFGHHGVLPEETARGQTFEVTVRLEVSLAAAARSDELAQAIDYRAVQAAVRAILEGPPRRLIETLAEAVAADLLEKFPATAAVEVEVLKPKPPVDFSFDGVSVQVRRERVGARQAFIGVGANLGDRWGTMRRALAALAAAPGILALEISAVYETAPVGVRDQPDFLNLVAGVETALAPEALLATLHALEHAAGRRRERETRWGPRPLDLDLLLYENETRAGPALVLPHPRMWERAFVTVPLRELLARSPRFARPGWSEVRARLTEAVAGPEVKPWTPPVA